MLERLRKFSGGGRTCLWRRNLFRRHGRSLGGGDGEARERALFRVVHRVFALRKRVPRAHRCSLAERKPARAAESCKRAVSREWFPGSNQLRGRGKTGKYRRQRFFLATFTSLRNGARGSRRSRTRSPGRCSHVLRWSAGSASTGGALCRYFHGGRWAVPRATSDQQPGSRRKRQPCCSPRGTPTLDCSSSASRHCGFCAPSVLTSL